MEYYSFGNIGFEFNSSCDFDVNDKLRRFQIDENKYNTLEKREYFDIRIDSLPKEEKSKVMGSGLECFFQRDEDRYYYFYQKDDDEPSCCSVNFDDKRREILINKNKEIKDLFTILRVVDFVNIFVEHEAMIFHSSFIDYDKRGVIFSGPSGIGKSTQADLWNKYEATTIINGDKTLIRREEGSWRGYGFPYSGSSSHCLNRDCPIKLIVILEQGQENKITNLSQVEKFRYIYSQILISKWNKLSNLKILDLVEKLIEEVDIVKLSCLPDRGAVELIKRYIEEGI